MTTSGSPSAAPHPAFEPPRWLRSGHAMTVFAWARARQFPALPAPEARLFQVASDTRVLAHCYWQPSRATRPTLLALHGLEGSSSVHYMQGLAAGAWARGWNAVLLNQRNCGETEHLTPGLYHSGLTEDPRLVIRELATVDRLKRFGVAGYSLGGNLALKLAGELGTSADLPVQAVAAVSPTIDLDLCVRAIERRINIPYHWNFVRRLRERMRRKAVHWPGVFDLTPLDSIWTIRRFDDVYTAPHHGFAGSADYYFRASALRVIDRIRRPALILAASDDPMVPSSQFNDAAVRGNAHVSVRLERHGGHCGFVSRNGRTGTRYWAESAVLEFLGSAMA
ncbi:MAG TPA: alpha/beta fold hydrolase [Vicinamibacterales bacterium]